MPKWIVDPEHTVAHFTARHLMVTDVHGQFNKISGVIYLDPVNLASTSVEMGIDAANILTGVERRDNHLRSDDFFDAGKYPKILFKSTRAEIAGSNLLKIHGELTIRDITRPSIFNVEYFGPVRYEDETGSYTSIGVSATTCLNREDFGMNWNNNFGAGNFMVGRHINIIVDAEADIRPE